MIEKPSDSIQPSQQADLAPSLPQIDELPLMTDLSLIAEIPIVTELPLIAEETEEEKVPEKEVPVLSENMLALVDDYKQRGWIILKDGCPDCDVPLMRNPDATSQVCVSCEILPPVDPDQAYEVQNFDKAQTENTVSEKNEQDVTPYRNSMSAPLVVYRTSLVLNSSPPPSPVAERPRSPPPKRTSVLDPIFDAIRRSYRSTTGKGSSNLSAPISVDFPRPPSRPSTPMPKSSPINKPFIVIRPPPRPINTAHISSPINRSASSIISAPRLLPRDKRRASQSMGQPPTKYIDNTSSKPRTPPSSVIGPQDGVSNAPGPIPNNMNGRRERKGSPDFSHAEVEKHSAAHKQIHEAEDEEAESHDEFEDAEEEMMIPLMRSREKIDYCVVCENYYFQKDSSTHHINLGKYPTIPQSTTAPATRNPNPHSSSNDRTSHLHNSPTIMPPASRATSPTHSPSHSRNPSQSRPQYGKGSMVHPPPIPAPPSFGLTGQQMMSDEDDIDPPVGAEELKRNMSLIRRKKKNFTSSTLPPPPPGYPGLNNSVRLSRYSQKDDRPLMPEVQLMVSASQKTMATLVSKLDAYRLALEVTENPTESQALTLQIKGLLECLKACRETLH
ncbi:hypothetical protein BGZ76_006914 [Entomortierella beljakovae]|nr:hypothetical protein BGZ76_006914 [Entomortierella beljakovae]